MERAKVNLIRYGVSVILLLLFASLKYLVFPENSKGELFSYFFGGGIFLYLFFYAISFFMGQLFNVKSNHIGVIFGSIILLELILIIIVKDSLFTALIFNREYEFFLLFHVIPLLTRLLHILYLKNTVRGL